MSRHGQGPRRSDSVDSYLRETRAAAGVALLALVGGVISDVLATGFWTRHGLLAGLASSLIVVMLSVAVVNEALERGRRRRWSVLAQYVMLQLVLNARLTWSALMEQAGLMPSGPDTAESLEAGAELTRDTARLTEAMRGLVSDPDRRAQLHDGIRYFVRHSDEVLGRWAAVMLNADSYAEIIDRHVELVSDLAWLGGLLDHFEPSDEDVGRRAKSRSHPAVAIEGEIDDDRLVSRLVSITQLAADLDRTTLDVALRLVPIEWWATRLGAGALTASTARVPPRVRAPLS